jgi:pimeloyl-ACP methyl ester carboxylesterase
MKINVDGYDIEYKETGTGDEVAVILQGWGTSLGMYDSMAACINGRFRVIQLDLPGFGASDEPRESWNVDEYADFFLHFMEKLGIGRATLIGHSYGGRVIIKLASRESISLELDRLVLVDAAGILPKKTFAQKMKVKRYKLLKRLFSLKPVHALFPEMIDDWKGRQGSADYRNATPVMRECLVKAVNEDLTELLPRIRQETLLVWGDMDTATPLSDGQLMEKLIPDAGLAVIKGAGHFSFAEQPAVFRSIMHSYFRI